MLEIKNTEVYGLKDSVIKSKYPKLVGTPGGIDGITMNDIKRGKRLGQVPSGSGHDCFLKGIIVQFDMKYSHYLSIQMQRYHWFDFVSSQSKMHKITNMKVDDQCNKYVTQTTVNMLQNLIDIYNGMGIDEEVSLKSYGLGEQLFNKYEVFMIVISNTPLGFELWAGMTTNYLQLKTMYFQRKGEKCREDWDYFCDWCENLPMFKSLVLGGGDED